MVAPRASGREPLLLLLHGVFDILHGALQVALRFVDLALALGGFRACLWKWTDIEPDVQAYLQFQDDSMYFKICVEDGIDRGAARDRIRERLVKAAEALDLPIRRPDRLGKGQTMTLADLAQLATRVEADDLWIDDRPFLIHFGEEYEGELDELADTGLATDAPPTLST